MEAKSILQALRMGAIAEGFVGGVIFAFGISLADLAPRDGGLTTYIQIGFGILVAAFGWVIIYNAKHYKEEKEEVSVGVGNPVN